MKCLDHIDRDAVGICNRCAKPVCPDCQVQLEGEVYCKECLAIKQGVVEKKEERSPVLAAILSFIFGGMGQIYNGQAGKGILIFFTSWLIIPWAIGIVDAYKTAKRINEGELIPKSRPGCLIASAVGMLVFLVCLFFLGLLAAIVIPVFLSKVNITDNEYSVRQALETVSIAAENYRRSNNGKYPLDRSVLNLPEIYNDKLVQGYTFSEDFKDSGYKIMASPKECGVSGKNIYIIESGGIKSSLDCKKELSQGEGK